MNAIYPTGLAEAKGLNGRGSWTPALIVNRDTGLREAGSYRRTLHHNQVIKVENSSVSAADPAPAGYENQYQVVLPYLGLFEYSVGSRTCQVDTASTLFVSPDCEFSDAHPLPGVGHAGIIISLSPELVEEIVFETGSSEAFSDMVRPSTHRLKLITHHMMRAIDEAADPLFADELTMAALCEAFSTEPKGAPRGSRAVEKAKLLLHSREGERLSLTEIAEEVGVTGIYLTQEFTRVEGIPLYRYQLQLRMNRALLELHHCEDITRLALDLGFSSHSHFTSAFGRHFGITPSEYRKGGTPANGALNGQSNGAGGQLSQMAS